MPGEKILVLVASGYIGSRLVPRSGTKTAALVPRGAMSQQALKLALMPQAQVCAGW